MYPAAPDSTAPIRKPTATSQPSSKPMMTNTAAPTTPMVVYWRARYASAPSWMAAAISRMRGVPASAAISGANRVGAVDNREQSAQNDCPHHRIHGRSPFSAVSAASTIERRPARRTSRASTRTQVPDSRPDHAKCPKSLQYERALRNAASEMIPAGAFRQVQRPAVRALDGKRRAAPARTWPMRVTGTPAAAAAAAKACGPVTRARPARIS